MRIAAICILLAASSADARVVSWFRSGNSVNLRLDDSDARIEWLTGVAFRYTRHWPAGLPRALEREPVAVEAAETADNLVFETKYVRLELRKADARMEMRSQDGRFLFADSAPARHSAESIVLARKEDAGERFYGLSEGRTFGMSSHGFGEYFASARAVRRRPGGVTEIAAPLLDQYVYYGPSYKEIQEQHMLALGQTDGLGPEAADVLTPRELPPETTRLNAAVNSWADLASLIRRLCEASLSAVLYPAVDVAAWRGAPEDVRAAAGALAPILPVVFDSAAKPSPVPDRDAWKPYLITYHREARDKGYPPIRPVTFQFPKDPNGPSVNDQFLLGDEVLVAPVLSASADRAVYLPMGLWTDLRTNIEYKGRQTVRLSQKAGGLPVFVKNGSLIPFASRGALELHYFPRSGSEFFLWEPGLSDISQFHATPILGGILRLEAESRTRRLCEWVLHHTGKPQRVEDKRDRYIEVLDRSALVAGAWYHDSQRNNLHVMMLASANGNEIVNVQFQP